MQRELITSAAIAAATSIPLLGSGVAGAATAPDETGKKYSEAVADLKKAGYTVEVSTTFGDQLPQSDCLVASQHNESQMKFGTKKYVTNESKNVLVSLSCYPTPASTTSAGYSAANPAADALNKQNAARAGQSSSPTP